MLLVIPVITLRAVILLRVPYPILSLIDLQLELYPTLISLLGKKNEMANYFDIGTNFRLESVYAILLRHAVS